MRRYLSLIPKKEALTIIKETFKITPDTETVLVKNASGKITATTVFAPKTLPKTACAGVDGFLVSSEKPLVSNDTPKINTGDEIPDEYDAIVPFEHLVEVITDSKTELKLKGKVRKNQNIKPAGSRVTKGTLLFPAGHKLVPSDIGVLLNCSIFEIAVRSLKIGLIISGDELLNAYNASDLFTESNSTVLRNIIGESVKLIEYPVVPDSPELITKAIETGCKECDVLIVSAGSGPGSRDYCEQVLKSLGRLLFHGIAIQPGKTMMVAEVNSIPVFGLPGSPMAFLTAFMEVVSPCLLSWGISIKKGNEITAILSESVAGESGIDEFIPVGLAKTGSKIFTYPVDRGSVGQVAFAKGTAILEIPEKTEGFSQGTEVVVKAFRDTDVIDKQIIITGTSAGIEYLSKYLSEAGYNLIFRSAPIIVASMCFSRGYCHGIIISSHDLEEPEVKALLSNKSTNMEDFVQIPICTSEFVICSLEKPAPEIIDEIKKMENPCPTVFLKDGEKITERKVPDMNAVKRSILSGVAIAGIIIKNEAEELYCVPYCKCAMNLVIRKDEEKAILQNLNIPQDW